MERFLRADAPHRTHVRRVARVEQRALRYQRRPVDEPADDGDVAPGNGGVVEDVMELRPAVDQVLEHRLAALPEVLRDPVEDLRVPDLVLHLPGQGELPPEL